MNQVCQIKLICQQTPLRDLFLAKMFKIHGHSFNDSSEVSSIHDISERQLGQMISQLSMQQLSSWILQIKGLKLSFSCDLNQALSQFQFMTLFLEVNDEIQDQTFDYLQKYSSENPNLLVVINKPTKSIQKQTVKDYTHSIVDIFNSIKIFINQDFIVEICLKENISITEGEMVEKMISMAKDRHQCHKKKNDKKGNIPNKIKNNIDSTNFFIDKKTAAENALKLIIQLSIFKIKQPKNCLQQLLDGNKDDAITYVTAKKQRDHFSQQVSECAQYQVFLNSKSQDQTKNEETLAQLKDRALQSLEKIVSHYQIKNKNLCYEEIFNHDFKEAVKQTQRMLRPSFIKQLQECKQLSEYLNFMLPVAQIDPQIQLRNNAQNAARKLLEIYEVVQVQECLKYSLEGKIDQILSEISNKKKTDFLKDYQNCEPLHKFLNFNNPPLQINLQQSAKKAIQIILNRFNIKNKAINIQNILNNNLDPVIQQIKGNDRYIFQKEIQNCPQLKQFLDSASKEEKQPQPSVKYDKQAHYKKVVQKLSVILKKFGVKKIEKCLGHLLQGDFQSPKRQIPKDKQLQYQKEMQSCKELQHFKARQNTQNVIRSILKTYQIEESEQCLEKIMELKLAEAIGLLEQSQQKRFKQQMLKCKQYQSYIRFSDFESSDLTLRLMKEAMSSLEIILEKYKVSFQKRNEIIFYILQKKIQQAFFYVKKTEIPNFQKDIKQCQKLHLFWKSLLPVDEKAQLKKAADTALRMLLEAYQLPQIDYILKNILNNQVQKGLQEVPKKKIPLLRKDIQQCKELQNYWLYQPAEAQISLKEFAKIQLIKICQKFEIKEENQCVICILEENVKQSLLYAKIVDRQNFLKAINQCMGYNQFLKSKEPKIYQDIVKSAEIALIVVLKKYEVQTVDECLKEIFAGNFINVPLNVKPAVREQFLRQISICPQYQKYKNSIQQQQPLDQSAMIRIKAEKVLKQILSKFVFQVEQCLEFIFNNEIQRVYSEIKTEKRAKFAFQLQNCEQFKRYKESLKKSDKLQEIIKNVLEKKGINQSFHHQIIQNIMGEGFTQLNTIISSQQYSSIIQELTQNSNFIAFLNNNQQRFVGKISFFYYFNYSAPQMDKIINLMIKSINEPVQTTENHRWLQRYLKSVNKDKLEMLEKEVQELSIINKITNDEKSNQLHRLFQQMLKILLISEEKIMSNSIDQFLGLLKINIPQAQQKIKELEIKNGKIKNIILKDECQKQLQKYKQLIQFNQFRNILLQKLNLKNINQLASNYSRELLTENMSWNMVQIFLEKQKERVNKILNSSSLIQYLKEKQNQIKCEIYKAFYHLNTQIIDSLMTPIIFQEISATIFIDEQVMASFIFQQISKILKLDITQFFTQLIYKQQKTFIRNNNSIVLKPDKILVYKKVPVMLQFRKKVFKIDISKNLSSQSLKTVVCDYLKAENITIEEENAFLFAVFSQSPKLVEIDEQILHLEIKNPGTLKYILFKQKIRLNVYYQVQLLTFILQQDKNINDLKKLINEKIAIPIDEQSLLYAINDKKQQEIINKSFEQIDQNCMNFTFTLISKVNLGHYGFHENYPLYFENYMQFQVEKQNDMESMIDSCNLKQEEEKVFFNQLIQMLFSAVKRRFSFIHTTDLIKEKLFTKNSQQIWSGGDFNENFLIYYILYNSDQKLRIQLMNILRNRAPLPLYFKTFNNINDIKKQLKINHQILWLMHPGLCITSIGLHTKNIAIQKGKTYLNNLLFFSNFQQSKLKHPICQGSPQILLKALGGIAPVNIIDIPSSCPDDITDKILNVTNVLIIHSWKGKIESQNDIKKIRQKYKIKYVLCFLRDSKTKQEAISKIRNVNFEENPFLELHNLEQNNFNKKEVSYPFLRDLRQKIWKVNNKANKDENISKNICQLFNNLQFQQFEQILSGIKENFYEMKPVLNKYQEMKKLQKQQKNEIKLLQQTQKLKKQIIKNKMSVAFEKVLLFVSRNKDYPEILMLRFKQVLKQIKNQQERKYYIINQYKKKFKLLPDNKKYQFQNLTNQAIRQIEALPKMKKIIKKDTPSEMAEQLSNIFDYFENEIKSMFFTIQVAWRQIQYLTTLGPEVMLGDNYLLDFLIDTKRKEIANSQPFELLDGDLLEMPKNIIQKAFEGFTDKVAVISILGPQSSGKSTLLNFLFGCDFSISEGRCTKGIYGTYFKFSNISLPNCDGVFLLDTEGLFANLNKKDESKRKKDFDAKLVLFCLAVSNIVIINTKGNIDIESSRILQSSRDRIKALEKQNMDWPQIFLILNQNNSSNITTSQADINKLRDIFSCQDSFSLNQAYNLTELTKSDLFMLPEGENLVKRQPRRQFLTLTNQLQHSLIQRIKSNNKIKSIRSVISFMESFWTTIQTLPDLGKTMSKEFQQMQQQIKNWKNQKINYLSDKKDQIVIKLKQGSINQIKGFKLFQQYIDQLFSEFKETFLREKQLQSIPENEKNQILLEEKNIQMTFLRSSSELNFQIKDLEKDRLAQKCKSEGSQYQKDAIRLVNNIQRKEKRKLTNQELEKEFNKAFNKSLEQIQRISNPQQHLRTLLSKTHDFYSNAIKSANPYNAGVPKDQWKQQIHMKYSQFSDKIKGKIFEVLGNQSNKYIELKNSLPTRILSKTGKIEASLKYFKMEDYFSKKKVEVYYEISIDHLKESLKTDILKNIISDMFSKKNQLGKGIQLIFLLLNEFFKNYGFKLNSLINFKSYVEYKSKFYHWFSPFEPKLDVIIFQTTNLSIKNNKLSKNNLMEHPKKQNFFNNQPSKNQIISKYTHPYSNELYRKQSNSKNSLDHPKIQQMDVQYNGNYNEQKEEREKQIKQYINIHLLQSKIANIFETSNYIASCNFLSNCLKEIINWSAIKLKIQKENKYEEIKEIINLNIHQTLKDDLKPFGISISCNDYYENFCHQKIQESAIEFKKINLVRPNEKQNEFFMSLKKFKKFDENKIQTNLKKNYNKSPSPGHLQIGSVYDQMFEVKPQYKNTKQLQTYISNDSDKVFCSVRSDAMKEFIYKELVGQKAFQRLFNNIDNIIQKSPNYLNYQTVMSIYIDVNKEIIEFNNDLNQVSHNLKILFTGYIHLYSIYLTWKKFSEAALKEANKPHENMLKTKADKFKYFITQTSDNDNMISEGQSDKFLNQVFNHFKELIQDHKQKVNKNQAQAFRLQYTRSKVQSKIDHECFNIASKPSDWMNYLTNPAKVIEQQYQSLINHKISCLQKQYKKCQSIIQLLKQFKQVIKMLLQKLKSAKIHEDTIHMQLFSIHKKTQKQISVADNEVLQIINGLLMNYFLDLLVNDQKAVYPHKDFNLEINQQYRDLKIIRQPTFNLRALINKLMRQKMSIARLYTFIEMINKKLQQNQIINQVELEKFQTKIKELLEITGEDTTHFRSFVTIIICKEQCPGCQRICGVEEAHTSKHQCKYGHQMRALGGVVLDNGQASVIRCEDVPLMSLINFNGADLNWKQFKEYWGKKPQGSWVFEDLKQNVNKQLFMIAWDLAGQTFCDKYNMKFVKANVVEQQKQIVSKANPTHYIFALDESGSMIGDKWNQLMLAFTEAINQIRNIASSQQYIKISILAFNQNCRIVLQNQSPSRVNLKIDPRSGGTIFRQPFSQALNLMNKYVSSSNIKFIFMTDGYAQYPDNEVNKIKQLKIRNPGKIEYSGIEFMSNQQIMKTICKQLGGTNRISYNVVQLTSAYKQIIKRA